MRPKYGALDLERAGAEVDVAHLQREGLARAQARLGEDLEDDKEAALLLGGLEEARPLLPRHGPDLLRAVGGRDRACAPLLATDLEPGVAVDDLVVDGVGQQRRQRRHHLPASR
jgi:hypothetical protein